MAQAYDFAIDKIGLDLMSFTIWNDYVTFLKGVEAIGAYAENQKITAIRKVRFDRIIFLLICYIMIVTGTLITSINFIGLSTSSHNAYVEY